MNSTPVQDEILVEQQAFSPVSDPWGDFILDQTAADMVTARLNALEALVREQHLATRDHVSKGLRECINHQRKLLNKVYGDLRMVSEKLENVQERHMADPTLLAGIVGLVNQALLYLQTTAPAVAPAVAAVVGADVAGDEFHTGSGADTRN